MIRKARSHNCRPTGEFPKVFNLRNWQFFYGLTLKVIDDENDIKVFKTLMEPPAVTRRFTARFWTFWCHFYEKLFLFCLGLFFLQDHWQFLTSIFLEVSRKVAPARKRKTNRATIAPFQFFPLANSSAEPWITEEENRSTASTFLWEQCLCLFQRWFTVFAIHIINTTIQTLKLCFILKIGQYLYR